MMRCDVVAGELAGEEENLDRRERSDEGTGNSPHITRLTSLVLNARQAPMNNVRSNESVRNKHSSVLLSACNARFLWVAPSTSIAL